ncbi:MAG: Deoxyguanosinetriphosphate triphosphohydrolase [Armatimonadota bacterium]
MVKAKGKSDLYEHDPEAAKSPDALPLEAMAVRISDRIAYLAADIEDAVRAGLLHLEDLPQEVTMTEPILGITNRLKDFMFANVYTKRNVAKEELTKGSAMLKQLFRLYMDHPEQLPAGMGTACARLCRWDDRSLRRRPLYQALLPAWMAVAVARIQMVLAR